MVVDQISIILRWRCGHDNDRMVVGFIAYYAIGAYHN